MPSSSWLRMLISLGEGVTTAHWCERSHMDALSVRVCAACGLKYAGDTCEGLADLFMGGFERREVPLVWIINLARLRQHRAYQGGVRQHRIKPVFKGVSVNHIVIAAIRAQIGEIGQQECAAAAAWCEFDDFLALMLGEAQDEIAAHRELRREPLGAERGGVNAVHLHEALARWIDWAVDETLDACAVRGDRILMKEQGKHEFAHRRAADIAGADKKDLHRYSCSRLSLGASIPKNEAVCSIIQSSMDSCGYVVARLFPTVLKTAIMVAHIPITVGLYTITVPLILASNSKPRRVDLGEPVREQRVDAFRSAHVPLP